jgi:hypothetical protein
LLIFAGANSAIIRKVERAERVWTYGLHTSPWQKNPAGGAPPRPDQHFRYSGNTGTYAIEAAALLGFTEVRMLGIDLRYDLAKTHFFGDGRALGCKLSRPLDYLVNRFRMVFEQLKSRGITLVNESPLEGPLDAVIPREASPWLRK